MKNHQKFTDKEARSNRATNNSKCVSSNYTTSSNNLVTAHTAPSAESAKTTLASKLLQKEKDRRQAALQFPNLPHNLLTSSPSLQVVTVSTGASLIDGANLKSYTTLRSPMAQEEYEHYKRISVIQTPTTAPSTPHSSLTYTQIASTEGHSFSTANLTAPPTHMQVQFFNTLNTVTDHEQVQEQPMDFSPKNSFTHSAKTSPFEMTGNYAIMA